MRYRIERKTDQTIYLQLYAQIKEDIVSGVYPYGSKLPSKRILAEETGTSVIPVTYAYTLLCDEGYVQARERSGYYVIYRKQEFLSTGGASEIAAESVLSGQRDEEPDTVDVLPVPGMKETGLPFGVLSKTMRRVLLDYGEAVLLKSPNKGCEILREAICAYLKRSSGIVIRPQQVVIGSGAEYLYGLIVQLLGEERVFGLEDPSYEKIAQVYRANGVTCTFLKLGNDGIRLRELAGSHATVLHVTPFHSFPSGVTASVSKRQEYIRWAKERGGYIIEDNYDSELTVSRKYEDTIFALAGQESVLYLNTFSQTIAPAIRIGYLILPENLLDVFAQKLGFYSCTVPTFEQYVLAELIRGGDFERHINRVRRARRKALEEGV